MCRVRGRGAPGPHDLHSHHRVACGYVANSPTSRVALLVFEILGEKTRETDLEWMYQLDASESTEHYHPDETSVVEWQLATITAAEEGRDKEAKAALESSTVLKKGSGAKTTVTRSSNTFLAALRRHCDANEDVEMLSVL